MMRMLMIMKVKILDVEFGAFAADVSPPSKWERLHLCHRPRDDHLDHRRHRCRRGSNDQM